MIAALLSLFLAAPLGERALSDVDDFTYQLQFAGADPLAPLVASAFDLVVIDFSRDGLSEFTPSEIASLKGGGDPGRRVLAYLSIGEAEKYRWYWKELPKRLLAGENPDWPGNVKVKYWKRKWQEVIVDGNDVVGKSYLDRIIDAGFDGVYLDIVDAFETFGPRAAGGNGKKKDAARKMIEFVQKIATHARVDRGKTDFLVVPQNGEAVFAPEWFPKSTLGDGDPSTPEEMAAAMRDAWFATIDAISVEDVFFRGGKDQNNPLHPDEYRLSFLAQYCDFGFPVFSVEYLTKSAKIDAFYADVAPGAGFVPYATVRDLDRMVVNAGHEPD